MKKQNDIRAKTESIIQDLLEIVLQDGYIAENENTIITTVNKLINSFINGYNEAWKDKYITNEERSNLSKLWNKIYNETEKIVGVKSQLPFEEINLLNHLSRKIKYLD